MCLRDTVMYVYLYKTIMMSLSVNLMAGPRVPYCVKIRWKQQQGSVTLNFAPVKLPIKINDMVVTLAKEQTSFTAISRLPHK